MLDSLAPFVSRLVGAIVGALAGILATKAGIEVDPATQASITTAIVVGAYGVVHGLLDKKIESRRKRVGDVRASGEPRDLASGSVKAPG